MYNVHLRLIGKRVLDFLLVLVELLSTDVTAEAFLLQHCQFDPKYQVDAVVLYQPFFLSED